MPDLSIDPLASEPFKFVVEDTALSIHSGLVASLSEPLQGLVSGSMCEADNRCAVLQDVTASTFLMFSEWAYTRSYTAPRYEPPGSEDDGNTYFPPRLSGKAKKKQYSLFAPVEPWPPEELVIGENIKAEFLRLEARLLPKTDDFLLLKSPSSTGILDEALRPHAELYVFADKYDIERLKSATARNFHGILAKTKLESGSERELLVLIQYVYENTPKRRDVVDLRTILRYYVGCEMNSFVKVPEFQQLLRKNEDFMEDFLRIVAKRTED